MEYLILILSSLIAFVAWVAWRVWTVETNHLPHIHADITEIKNDIKWLVKFHEEKEK